MTDAADGVGTGGSGNGGAGSLGARDALDHRYCMTLIGIADALKSIDCGRKQIERSGERGTTRNRRSRNVDGEINWARGRRSHGDRIRQL